MAKKGFTLVELLAIIIIIGILATITTPVVLNVVKESKQNTFTSEYKMVKREIEKQMTEEGIKVLEDCDSSKRRLSSLNIRNSKKIDHDSSYYCYNVEEECNYLYLKTKDHEKGECISKQKNISNIQKVIISAKTISGKPLSTCNIENVTLTATVRPAKKDSYTYQWYQNGQAIAGATSKEYTTNISTSDRHSYEWYVIAKIKSNGVTMTSNKISSMIALAAITDTKPTLVSTINSIIATQNQYSGTCEREVYYRIKKESDQEYSNWQKENTFNNLKSGTSYQIQTKVDDKVSQEASIQTKEDLKAKIEVTGSTSNSISVKATCTPTDVISSYEFKIDDGQMIHNKTNATYTFNGLSSGEHTIYVKCTSSNSGNAAEATVKGTTKEISDIQFTASPATGWTTSKLVTITYNDTNITNPEYYFYSSVNATSKINVSVCGTGNEPGICSGTTTKIETNKWYKTTSKTPQIEFNEIGNIRARISDGTNSKSKEYTVSQIDPNEPSVKAEVTPIATDKITVTARCSSVSGISKYEFKMDDQAWIESSDFTYTYKGLKPYNAYGQDATSATHSFQVRCTSGAGRTKTSEMVNERSKPYIPPSYAYNDSTDSTGKLSGTNWRTSKAYQVQFNETNINNPTFYFYTTVPVTSDVLVKQCNSNFECGEVTSNIQPNIWYQITTSHSGYQYPKLTFKQPGKIVSRINDGTSYYQSSSNDIEFITGTTIKDYETRNLAIMLDARNSLGENYCNFYVNEWKNLVSNNPLKSSITSTTSGWKQYNGPYHSGTGSWVTDCNQTPPYGLYFDGVDDYAYGANSNLWAYNFTLEVVYRPLNTSSGYVLVDHEKAGIGLSAGGGVCAYIGDGYKCLTPPKSVTVNNIYYRSTSVDKTSDSSTTLKVYSGEDTTSDSNFYATHYYFMSPGYQPSKTWINLGCNPGLDHSCQGSWFNGYIYSYRAHIGVLNKNQISKNAYIDRMRYGF